VRDLSRRLSLAVAAALLLSTAAVAQRQSAMSQGNRPLLGPQAGFATNDFDAFIGAQFAYPVANQFDIYPSFDIFFPGNNVTAWALNADVRYWPKLHMANPGLYVGAGLDYTHASVDLGPPFGSVSSSDVGLGLLGGWDFKTSTIRPFVQLRVVVGDADRLEFGGGINFKM
jgi:opacity protein-like surface antigen